MRDQYDVVIVGGGMIGAAIATGLANTDLKVAVLEHSRPPAFEADQPLDLRVSALSPASIALLDKLGVWQKILGWRSAPYKRMRVWELDQRTAQLPYLAQQCVTEFNAEDLGEIQLGCIVENRLIQLALLEQVDSSDTVDLIDMDVSSIDYSAGASLIQLADGREILARLVIAADGGNSMAREAAGIGVHQWDYAQMAMVINVSIASEQLDITWQQFTPSGPRALLPLPGSHASLVWYDSPERIQQLLSLDDQSLKAEILANFPDCLNEILAIEGRAAFPLRRLHAQQYWKPGVVLAGDSAHQINPLAGQGVNLGLQDVDTLLQLMLEALDRGEAPDSAQVLNRYEQIRRKPNLVMMQAMDLFYRVFSNDRAPIKLVRNLALGAVGLSKPIRNRAIRIAAGLDNLF